MRRLLTVAALLSLAALPAGSYQLIGATWPNARCTFYHHTASMTGAYLSEFQAAEAVWNNAGSGFQFLSGGASSGTPYAGNGVTEVGFENLGMMGYAVTKVMNTGSTMTETDIAFNSSITWTTSADGVNPDFRTVAIHELGHALGLAHETSVPSVMKGSGSPAAARWTLYADDIAGIQYLYPSSTPPPPDPDPDPDPDPNATDLTLDAVSYTPEDAGPGDVIDVSYEMRNAGLLDAGLFFGDAYVTHRVRPTADDRWLGRCATGDTLEAGADGENCILGVTIPPDLLPGSWRIGVIIDRDAGVPDSNRANNARSAVGLMKVTREPIAVRPGTPVAGSLGPFGEDRFLVALPAGTFFALRSRADDYHDLTVRRQGSDEVLAASRVSPKEGLAFETPEEGVYEVTLGNRTSGLTDYLLRSKAKAMKTVETILVAGETRVPLPAFEGGVVKASLKVTDGPPPSVDLEGADGPLAAKGGKAKIGPCVADGEGLTLVLTPAGAPATVLLKVSARPPKKGPLIER